MSNITIDTNYLKDSYKFYKYNKNSALPLFKRINPKVMLSSSHFKVINLVKKDLIIPKYILINLLRP
jgi:hypothetical protein